MNRKKTTNFHKDLSAIVVSEKIGLSSVEVIASEPVVEETAVVSAADDCD